MLKLPSFFLDNTQFNKRFLELNFWKYLCVRICVCVCVRTRTTQCFPLVVATLGDTCPFSLPARIFLTLGNSTPTPVLVPPLASAATCLKGTKLQLQVKRRTHGSGLG